MSGDIRQLVDQCLADDPTAMVRLVDRFRGQVLSLCYRMLGQWQDAEDAAQETFWRVSKHLSAWDTRREFEPWLFMIAANRCRSALARRVRQVRTEPFDEGQSADWTDLQREAAHSLREEVQEILKEVPAEWSRAFQLFHEFQFGYQEIASEMNRPVGTVKTWVHRTRKVLLDRLCERNVLNSGREDVVSR